MNENVRQDNWINKGLRQHEGEEQRLLSGGNVSCLITEKRAVEYGKKKKRKERKEASHMLHFSSCDTFLCSSWLCALQAAILEEIIQNSFSPGNMYIQG